MIRQELPHVEKIILEECDEESRLRGHPVDRRDPSVRLRVADALLNGAGQRIREAVERASGLRIAGGPQS